MEKFSPIRSTSLSVPDDQSTTCASTESSPISDRGSTVGTDRTSVSGSTSRYGLYPSAGSSRKTSEKEGWPMLAKEMADQPDYESFRRFRELNVKNLLYYQVEIAALERDLMAAEAEDSQVKNRVRKRYVRSAERLLEGGEDLSEDGLRQRNLVVQVRSLLKKYNEALLLHAQVTILPEPDYTNVEALRIRLRRGLCGRNAIMGAGSDTWGDFNEIKELDEEQKRNWVKYMKGLMKDLWPLIKHLVVARERPVRDLVTVHRRKAGDTSLLTRWVTEEWIPFYHNHIRCSHPVESNEDPRYISAKRYSQSSILRFTAFVTMVAACLLPTVAIGVLTTAQTTLQKLGYIAGFTALFSIGVMWLTDASTSRIQVFTATAAFSAVLVVFVQGQ